MQAFKAMGNRVSAAVGFDPTIIITIITTIVTLLQQCKKPASRASAEAMIEDEFMTIVRNKRVDKCPLQFRRIFRESGVRDKEDMNDIWAEIVLDAKANKGIVASALAT